MEIDWSHSCNKKVFDYLLSWMAHFWARPAGQTSVKIAWRQQNDENALKQNFVFGHYEDILIVKVHDENKKKS